MNILTKKDLVDRVAKCWEESYRNPSNPPHKQWRQNALGDTEVIYDKLIELRKHPNPKTIHELTKEINDIIGNSSWTDLICDECGKIHWH